MSDADVPTSDPASGRGPKAVAKRAIAPFERRFEIATSKALEAVVQREMRELQAAIQADLATIVELGYELQRRIDRLEALEARLAAQVGDASSGTSSGASA